MTFILVISLISFICSFLTLVIVLALLGRKEFQYATKKDLEELVGRLRMLGLNQSRLWRQLEALDDRCDSAGLPVLRHPVYRDQAQVRD